MPHGRGSGRAQQSIKRVAWPMVLGHCLWAGPGTPNKWKKKTQWPLAFAVARGHGPLYIQ
eukprot:10554435-Lingulodinium_polyedra.AAC.1